MTFESLYEPVLPCPNLVDPDDWEVESAPPNRGVVGVTRPEYGSRKIMQVDGSRTKLGELIRKHEMLHVKYSSDLDTSKVGKEAQEIAQALEDCRVHGLGYRYHGLDPAEYFKHKSVRAGTFERLFQMLPSFPVRAAIYSAISAWYLIHDNPQKQGELKDMLVKRLEVEYDSGGKKLAADAMREAEAFFNLKTDHRTTSDVLVKAISIAENIETWFDQKNKDEEIQRRIKQRKDLNKPVQMATVKMANGTSEWREMKIKEPARPTFQGSKFRGLARRKSDIGAVFKHPHRYCTDKAVFESTSSKHGGVTVLIDASGSMSLSVEEVQEILDEAEGATVASYSKGTMYILAKDQYRVDKIPSQGGANGIDGPALEWLASKHGEKIWVSDGRVNGRSSGENLSLQCKEIVEENSIHHVADTGSGASLLRALKNNEEEEIGVFN